MLHSIDTGFIRADADPGLQDITTIFSRVLAEIVEIITDLLSGEPSGLAVDFTDEDQPLLSPWDQEWVQVKQNASPHTFFTQSGTSPKYVKGSATTLAWSPHNIILQSQNLGATWTNDASTESVNSTTAPDGTATADTLIENSDVAQFHDVRYDPTVLSGVVYTYSVYAKASSGSRRLAFTFCNNADSAGVTAVFDIDGGQIGVAQAAFGSGWTAVGSAIITNVGSGWYRCALTAQTGTTAGRVYLTLDNGTGTGALSQQYNGDGTSGLYLWGMQLNRGIAPTAYIATTTNTAYGLPISYGEGLLVEPAATNVCPQSQNLGTTWVNTNSSESLDATTAPDGSTTADKLVVASDTGQVHSITNAITVSSGTTYTFSVYLKAAERTWARFAMGIGFAVPPTAYVNLADGTLGTVAGGTASISTVGNGWHRVKLTAEANASGSTSLTVTVAEADGDVTFDGNGTDGIYVWGAQAEVGAFGTSYVPTLASSSTRATDDVFVPISSFSGTDKNNTIYADYLPYRIPGSSEVIWQWEKDADTWVQNYNDVNGPNFGALDSGDFDYVDMGTNVAARSQTSIAWADNNSAGSFNGSSVFALGAHSFEAGYVDLNIGSLNGLIMRLVYVPRRVIDGDLPTWRYNSTGDLLDGEPIGLAVDFTDTTYYNEQTWNQYEWVQVKKTYSPHTFFTQSGTSPKYVKNSATTIGWSPHNLILQSQTIGSWSLAGAGRLTVSSDATTAPDGTSTADQLIEGTNAATTHWADTAAITLIAGFAYTWSCYLKPNGRTWVVLNAIDDILDHRVYFELAGAGTVGTTAAGSTATITSIANGWYFVTNTLVSNGSGPEANLEIMLAEADNDVTYTGDGTSGVYAWGAQVNRGYFPTAYIVTTTAAKIGLPISYSEGLLCEPAATNLCIRSQEMDNATFWSANNSGVTANNTTAPDGSLTADRVTASSTSACNVAQNVTGQVNDATHTFSVYAKAGTAPGIYLSNEYAASGPNSQGSFNLSAGTNSAGTMTDVGSGWYRCSVTATNGAETSKNCVVYVTDAAGGISVTNGTYVYLWGAQVETGTSVATSYIPTVAASATRAADAVNVAVSTFPYSQTEGTLYFNWIQNVLDAGADRVWQISDGTAAERWGVVTDNTTTAAAIVLTTSIVRANLANTSVTANAILQHSFAVKINDFAASLNGGAIQTDTVGAFPAAATIFEIGHGLGAFPLNGIVRKIAYVPRRVIDGDLPTWRYEA